MRSNKHHLFYPRKQYASGISKKFRELPCNITRIDSEIHKLLHTRQRPPTKPPIAEMKRAIKRHADRKCNCYEGG